MGSSNSCALGVRVLGVGSAAAAIIHRICFLLQKPVGCVKEPATLRHADLQRKVEIQAAAGSVAQRVMFKKRISQAMSNAVRCRLGLIVAISDPPVDEIIAPTYVVPFGRNIGKDSNARSGQSISKDFDANFDENIGITFIVHFGQNIATNFIAHFGERIGKDSNANFGQNTGKDSDVHFDQNIGMTFVVHFAERLVAGANARGLKKAGAQHDARIAKATTMPTMHITLHAVRPRFHIENGGHHSEKLSTVERVSHLYKQPLRTVGVELRGLQAVKSVFVFKTGVTANHILQLLDKRAKKDAQNDAHKKAAQGIVHAIKEAVRTERLVPSVELLFNKEIQRNVLQRNALEAIKTLRARVIKSYYFSNLISATKDAQIIQEHLVLR